MADMEAEKIKRTRKKTEKESFSVTLDDGSVIDLTSYDWKDVRLSRMQKLFIFWFTYPGSPAFHESAKAARKAGYSEKSARSSGYALRQNPEILSLIQEFDARFQSSIDDAYKRIIRRKIVRAEFDAASFYRFSDEGDVFLKNPDELTEEQKLCIDGIDFAGQKSIPNYKLPNRTAEENALIALYEKAHGQENKDGYEVETTAEIIKGNLQVKTKVMSINAETALVSELKNNGGAGIVED